MTAVVVTGATGYLGRHLADQLLAQGRDVVNLTGHPERPDPFGGRVRTELLDPERPAKLAYAMRGADVLVNTFWVRFERGPVTFDGALRTIEALTGAARTAGVRRIVHVSVANAAPDSPLAYFRGKARGEELVRSSGLSWAIARPTILYGGRDTLMNNIAWALRHLPAFAVPGDGAYPIQPVHVDDLAARLALMVDGTENEAVDAGGPERYTFDELLRLVRWTVGSRALIVHMPPRLALLGAMALGTLMRDVLMTDDEVRGLMAGLLVSGDPPVGSTSLAQYLVHHRHGLGRHYASELARHYRAAA